MSGTKEKRSKKRSFKVSLLSIALIPMVLVGVILSIVAIFETQASLEDNYIARLFAVNQMLYNEYKTSADGVDSLTYDEEKDIVYMNGEDISKESTKMEQSFDDFKERTDIDCTLFVGEMRRVTSVVSNGEKPIGTPAADTVIEKVLQEGQEYTSSSTQVAGQEYMVAYTPIKDKTGAVVGMFFSGIPKKEYNAALRSVALKMNLITIVLIIATILIILFVARRITDVVLDADQANERIAQGELNFELKASSLKRGMSLESWREIRHFLEIS